MAAALRRFSGNVKLFTDLLREFDQKYGDAGRGIREAFAREDWVAARHLAHELKGLAGNLAITEVAAAAQALENNFGKGAAALGQDNLAASLDRLDLALKTLVETVARLPTDAGPTAAPPPAEAEAPAVSSALADLDRLLMKNSLAAEQQFASLKNQLGAAAPPSATALLAAPLEGLEAGVSRLDFKEARQHLHLLARILGVALP